MSTRSGQRAFHEAATRHDRLRCLHGESVIDTYDRSKWLTAYPKWHDLVGRCQSREKNASLFLFIILISVAGFITFLWLRRSSKF
jgi:hypothetical protein